MSIEGFVRDRALVFLSKNKDYGDSFYESIKVFPDAGKIRILDKVNRLKSLLKNNGEHEVSESMEDTILDLFNYGAMTLSIDNGEYSLSNIVEIMYLWAECPQNFVIYTNGLLTKENNYLGFTDLENSYVSTIIQDLISGR